MKLLVTVCLCLCLIACATPSRIDGPREVRRSMRNCGAENSFCKVVGTVKAPAAPVKIPGGR